jgi:hypothetical protein
MFQEEVSDSERYGIAILDVPLGWSEKILESQKMANFAIIVLIILVAVPLVGIGFLTTRPFTPADAAQVASGASAEVAQ